MNELRVYGHALRGEGAPHDSLARRIYLATPGVAGDGQGACECDDLSAVSPSGAARKRWHRLHKRLVLDGQIDR